VSPVARRSQLAAVWRSVWAVTLLLEAGTGDCAADDPRERRRPQLPAGEPAEHRVVPVAPAFCVQLEGSATSWEGKGWRRGCRAREPGSHDPRHTASREAAIISTPAVG
jgi:hypothetical protein